ncbi:hypothetical protein [Thiohalomonas denitrificans]|uniref:hypothetical protein n=1 Tax=Thiohalomonas denitrificans TaxID=415747 RepID=UPI0026F2D998|nr:hypothetical protein [Thiohalomonas denitrificans]
MLSKPVSADNAGGAEFASVQERTDAAKQADHPDEIQSQPGRLLPFADNPRYPMPKGLPLYLPDYLDLVDFIGRRTKTHPGKPAAHPFHRLWPTSHRSSTDLRRQYRSRL